MGEGRGCKERQREKERSRTNELQRERKGCSISWISVALGVRGGSAVGTARELRELLVEGRTARRKRKKPYGEMGGQKRENVKR